MGDPPSDASMTRRSAASGAAVRGAAFSLLIGGAICLYYGYSWLVDAPGSASEEATQSWFAVDWAFRWALRALGITFLAAAGLAFVGLGVSMILATVAEGGFGVLLSAIAIETFLEGRADNSFDPMVILFVILAVFGFGAAKRSWELYTAVTHGQPTADSAGP